METTTHVFQVRTVHCDDCAALIDDTLRALPGVRTAQATLRTGDISVELDPGRTSPDAVVAAITELGFQVKPPPAPPVQTSEPVEPQVSDSAWRILEPVLRDPAAGPTTRRRDHRRLFEGIAFKHRTGVPWREVPAAFGPWQTLYAHLARWRADGTWGKVVAASQRTDVADELTWVSAAAE